VAGKVGEEKQKKDKLLKILVIWLQGTGWFRSRLFVA